MKLYLDALNTTFALNTVSIFFSKVIDLANTSFPHDEQANQLSC